MSYLYILSLAIVHLAVVSQMPTPAAADECVDLSPTASCLENVGDCTTNTVMQERCQKSCKICTCDTPWISDHGQCFQVINTDVHEASSWSSARMYCSMQDPATTDRGRVNADLAVPNDITTFKQFILDNGNPDTKYWIGGSNLDKTADGAATSWRWINAISIKTATFDKQVNPWFGECISIITKNAVQDLASQSCVRMFSFVCEKNI